MDRRKSLKLIALTGGAALAGCGTPSTDKKEAVPTPTVPATTVAEPTFNLDRNAEELKYEKELLAKEQFFTDHELKTITVLGDIIIPADEVSGSASDAKVPEFIEFIVKDKPELQTPLRGGLRWLDVQCLNKYEKAFVDCPASDQIKIIDQIAYPKKAKKGMEQGVAFFTLIRDLVATAFYTSEMGVKDIGYAGNTPNQWRGVPDDVLHHYKLAYTEKELHECVK
jgi:gluconate 2-dehydrogenase gamma chain